MKIGFYSSGLHIAGGGERYLTSIISEAVKMAQAEVTVMSPTPPRPTDWERLGVSLSSNAFLWRRTRDSLLVKGTSSLDLFVAMRGTDVPPISHAKRSVAIIQFPEANLFTPPRLSNARDLAGAVKTLIQRRAVASYDSLVCYSAFVQFYVAQNLHRSDAVVIYPPVDAATSIGPKEPLILGVGRFIAMKRQDALLEAFQELRASLPENSPWELHLAGGLGTDRASDAYIAYLRRLARGLPVIFHPNISLLELRSLYQRASIFWHAAGFGCEDEPALQEHFGITTVEAMNHACVPIVIGLGGQPEIVTDGSDGLLWLSPQELVSQTLTLILSPERRSRLAHAAAQRGERFAVERFRQRVQDVILSP